MSEEIKFISWVEKGNDVLFLDSHDIKASRKLSIEGPEHYVIRRFYERDRKLLGGGRNCENRNFWDGKLPQKIKDAWNKGKLDRRLGDIEDVSLEHILMNAPADFAAWVILKNLEKDCLDDYKTVQKSTDIYFDRNSHKVKGDYWYYRLIGYAANGIWERMRQDPGVINVPEIWHLEPYRPSFEQVDHSMCVDGHGYVHKYKIDWVDKSGEGYIVDRWRIIDRPLSWYVRLAGYLAGNNGKITTPNWKAMQKDPFSVIRAIGLAAAKDWKKMQKEKEYSFCGDAIRTIGYAADGNMEVMLKKAELREDNICLDNCQDLFWFAEHYLSMDVGKTKQARTNYLLQNQGSCNSLTRLAACALRKDWDAMQRDEDEFNRLVGYAATGNFEAIRIDPSWELRLVAYVVANKGKKFARPMIR